MPHENTNVQKALVGLRVNLQATLRAVLAMERSATDLDRNPDAMTFQRFATDVDALRTLHHATTDLLLAVDSALAGVIADASPREAVESRPA